MKSRRIVIELLGSRVDVVLYDPRNPRNLRNSRNSRNPRDSENPRNDHGDHRAVWRRVPIPYSVAEGRLSDDAASWVREVRQLGSVLKPIVTEMGLGGEEAIVLYRSPTQAVDLAAFDSRAVRSRFEACEAAKLAVFDSVTHSSATVVCEAAIVGRDHSPGDGVAGGARNLHVVVAADREDVVAAIVHMVEGAGLRFASATPVEAAVTAQLAKSCLDQPGRETALLYIGENSSLFLYASNGALRFSRRVNLGSASLAAALGRAVRVEGGSEPVQLPMETAQEVLYGPFGGGLADRTAVVYPPLGLHGYDLLPMIQPMLQRSIVEIRQSLRFGVSGPETRTAEAVEADVVERENVKLVCTGPGSAIPGLPELIGTELETEVERDLRMGTYRYDEPGAEGSELAFVAAGARSVRWCAELNLQPAQLAHQRSMKRVRRLMWTGAAAALAVIAFDAFRFSIRVHEAKQTADALISRAASDEALRLTAHRLITAMEHMHRLEGLIDHETGARVDFRAAMHELSLLTPRSVRYTNVSFRRGKDGEIEGMLSGFAAQPSQQTQTTELRLLVDALRASPLFDSVVLGSVQYTTMSDVPGERFEATAVALPAPSPRLATLPAEGPEAALSAADEGGAP